MLCGHSYAGMVLTGVTGLVPDRIRSLVDVDASLPEEGLKADPSWTVRSAPCGHDVMVDMPELLVELLLEAA
ncbi:hypothetical protein WMF30_43795 [Sorangium sp. So ce134]